MTNDLQQIHTLREAAEKWMDEHPREMNYFRKFAEQMRCHNRQFGIKLLAERVRWEAHILSTDGDFKICNSFTAYIARRLCQEDPRLAELIRCRVTPAADKPFTPNLPAPEVDPLEKP